MVYVIRDWNLEVVFEGPEMDIKKVYRAWINNPEPVKPGSNMPRAFHTLYAEQMAKWRNALGRRSDFFQYLETLGLQRQNHQSLDVAFTED